MTFRVIIQAAGITWLDGDYRTYSEAKQAVDRMAGRSAGRGCVFKIIRRVKNDRHNVQV